MKEIKINPGLIDNLDDAELVNFARNPAALLETPGAETEKKIRAAIRDANPPGKWNPAPLVKYGIAAAIILIIAAAVVLSNWYTPLKTEYLVTGGIAPGTAYPGSIKSGTVIQTAENTWHRLQIADQALLEVAANSRVTMQRLDSRQVRLELEYGELSVKTFPAAGKTGYEIRTPDAAIRFGSTVLVRCSSGSTYLALLSGKAAVKTGTRTTGLLPGEEAVVRAAGGITKNTLGAETARQLAQLHGEELSAPAVVTARLTLTCTVPGVEVQVGSRIVNFTDNIILNLGPGTYSIRVRRQGYKTSEYTVTLAAGETKHLTCDPEPGAPGTTAATPQPTPRQTKSTARTVSSIYPPVSSAATGTAPILGFAGSENYLVAVMAAKLIFFNKTGKAFWEYAADTGLLFSSLPVIYKDRLYISSMDALLIIDIAARKTETLPAPGIIPNGFGIVLHQDKLYFPYSAGIYTLNTTTNVVELLISFNSPVTPLFSGQSVYLTSYIKPEIAAFSLSGQPEKNYTLPGKSSCTPVKIGSYIYAGDSTGNIYMLDEDLSLRNSKKVDSSIVALVPGSGEQLFALAGNGILYGVHYETLEVTQIIKVDKTPGIGIYYYKSPVIMGNRLYLGTDTGQLLLIDNGSGQVVEQLTISNAAISCSVFSFQNVLVAGTNMGEIYKVE